MRIAPWLIAVFAVGSAGAQQTTPNSTQNSSQTPVVARQPDSAYSRAMRRLSLEQRAHELRPRRRDEPLRYLNITDYEVREIQLVAAKHVPKAIVNISPVVTGCPCEEGPQCTDQVFIVANAGEKTAGLQLSRIKNSWTVGVVQTWWLHYDALRARRATMNPRAFDASEAELLRELPQCVGELVPATASATSPSNSSATIPEKK